MYQLKNIDRAIHDRMIKKKYLKKYYPIIWEMQKERNTQE